jgi:hypothetical protein
VLADLFFGQANYVVRSLHLALGPERRRNSRRLAERSLSGFNGAQRVQVGGSTRAVARDAVAVESCPPQRGQVKYVEIVA